MREKEDVYGAVWTSFHSGFNEHNYPGSVALAGFLYVLSQATGPCLLNIYTLHYTSNNLLVLGNHEVGETDRYEYGMAINLA